MPGGARSMKGEKQMIYKNITFKADPFSYKGASQSLCKPPN